MARTEMLPMQYVNASRMGPWHTPQMAAMGGVNAMGAIPGMDPRRLPGYAGVASPVTRTNAYEAGGLGNVAGISAPATQGIVPTQGQAPSAGGGMGGFNPNDLYGLAPALGAILSKAPQAEQVKLDRMQAPDTPLLDKVDYSKSDQTYASARSQVDQTGNSGASSRAMKAVLTGQKLNADHDANDRTQGRNRDTRNRFSQIKSQVNAQNTHISNQEADMQAQENAAVEQFKRDRMQNTIMNLTQFGRDKQAMNLLPQIFPALNKNPLK